MTTIFRTSHNRTGQVLVVVHAPVKVCLQLLELGQDLANSQNPYVAWMTNLEDDDGPHRVALLLMDRVHNTFLRVLGTMQWPSGGAWVRK